MTSTVEIIYDAIREMNGQLAPASRLACAPETVLVGDGGALDSLGLINLLVSIEEAVAARLGSRVMLIDEQHLAAQDGPFHTVASLAAYIDAHVSS